MQSLRRKIGRGNAMLVTNTLGTFMLDRPKRISFKNWSKKRDRLIEAEINTCYLITAPLSKQDIQEGKLFKNYLPNVR